MGKNFPCKDFPTNLTEFLLEKYASKKGEIGRYNTSSLWAITHGYLSVKEFLEGKPIDSLSAFRMWQGTGKHLQIQELLEGKFEIETKVEFKSPEYDWILVGKADALSKDTVLEIKTSTDLMFEAKPWAEYQCRAYCSLFEKKKGIIVQPIVKDSQIFLKTIGEVKRDDKWFQGELKKLDNFHLKLK